MSPAEIIVEEEARLIADGSQERARGVAINRWVREGYLRWVPGENRVACGTPPNEVYWNIPVLTEHKFAEIALAVACLPPEPLANFDAQGSIMIRELWSGKLVDKFYQNVVLNALHGDVKLEDVT